MIDALNKGNRQLKDGIRSLQAGMLLDADLPVGLSMDNPQAGPASGTQVSAPGVAPEDEEWVRVSKALDIPGLQRVGGQKSLQEAPERGGGRKPANRSYFSSSSFAMMEEGTSGRQCSPRESQAASREGRPSPGKASAAAQEAQGQGAGEPARREFRGLNGLKRGRCKASSDSVNSRATLPGGGQDAGGGGTPIPLEASP